MKKFLIVLFCLVAALGVIFVAGGAMLDKSYDLSRSMIIDAKPGAIHDYVGDLKKWDEWSPWKTHDSSIVVTLGKKTDGVGASQTWTSDQGNGELTFTRSERKTGIAYDMAFIQEGERFPSQSEITYEEIGKKTRVTWSMKGEMNVPILGGWFALMMDSQVGPMFEEGLDNLKRKVESK